MSPPDLVRPPVQPLRVSRIIVVLPAYNEEANIGNLLRRIFESLTDEHLGFSIIVVDDGSSDQTQRILEEYGRDFPLIVHRHEQNQGLGATIRDGLREAAALASVWGRAAAPWPYTARPAVPNRASPARPAVLQ